MSPLNLAALGTAARNGPGRQGDGWVLLLVTVAVVARRSHARIAFR